MKTLITKNLLKFTLTTILLTILFRMGLSSSITNKMTLTVIICAVVYGILMWFNGSYFGRKEYEYLPIYDIGFRFHLSTFLAHNLISILWFTFAFESKYENVKVIYITALIWSFFLIIHLVYYLSVRKSTIKDLDKEDLFEYSIEKLSAENSPKKITFMDELPKTASGKILKMQLGS